MLILNEHLHSYDTSVDKNNAESGQYITMSFLSGDADLRFSMGIDQAKQLHESLEDALKDE